MMRTPRRKEKGDGELKKGPRGNVYMTTSSLVQQPRKAGSLSARMLLPSDMALLQTSLQLVNMFTPKKTGITFI